MTGRFASSWPVIVARMSGRRRRRVPAGRAASPFELLGLDPDADLTDDEVRAAWRRIAAATHPDRADGGDPQRFAVAAAAFTELRTQSGRGEARANLTPFVASGPAVGAGTTTPTGPAVPAGPAARLLTRMRLGRPARLLLRVAAAGAAGAAGFLVAGPGPAGPALATGALTWLVITGRRDLSPP